MSVRLALLPLFLLTACGPFSAPDDEHASVLTERDPLERVTCDPLMNHFPVADVHNIGYDHASCGTGTCETSCPDVHANSDWGGAHRGIDIFAYQGAPLAAVVDGTIERVGVVSSTSGLRVRLRDACGWEYYYGHLDEAYVQEGQFVSAGQIIGTMGRTGTSSTHLHFNVSPDGAYSNDIDPIHLLVATSPSACSQPTPPLPVPDPTPPAPPVAPGLCGLVGPNTPLGINAPVSSCDGRFSLVMQGDGNLVLYGPSGALWHTNTHGHAGATAVFQGDGNLVVYGLWGQPLWYSGTHGNPGSFLSVQDDGNLVVYSSDVTPLWATGTHGW